MELGLLYEFDVPQPWAGEHPWGQRTAERQAYKECIEQIVHADKHGFHTVWCVEHHFLEEYSHCSAPEVFLAAAAARTKQIRLGHGIRQVIPNYNHPARTAEGLGMLESRIVEGVNPVSLECGWPPAESEKVLGVALGQELRE